MNLDLSNRHAVVCGSTKGIGRACAAELAALGASVTLLARDEAALRQVEAALPGAGGAKHGHAVADLSNPAAARSAIEGVLRDRGPVHILINNTGGPPAGPLIDASTDALTAAFNSLLLSAHALTQAVVPGMREARYGRVINIASTSIKEPIPGLGLSNAVRAAVANWAKTLSQELGAHGITVNNVLPGYTDTDRLRQIFAARSARENRPADAIQAETIAKVPAGRLGLAEEIAAAVAFLASPAAAYISGINLPVDGGRLASL